MSKKHLYIEVLIWMIEMWNHNKKFYCYDMLDIIGEIKNKIGSDENTYWVYYNLRRNDITPDKGTIFDKGFGCFNREKAINDLRKYKLKTLVYD